MCPKMDSPLRPAVIGSRFLRNQCCVLIFERAISLFRFGRQTVDSFIHRATRSKMAGFKTAPLFWGYGQGRFFGCAGSAKFCAYSGVSLILTRPGEGVLSGWTPRRRILSRFATLFHECPKWHPSEQTGAAIWLRPYCSKMSESTTFLKWKIGFASRFREARGHGPFPHLCGIRGRTNKKTITQNCAIGYAGRYAQNYAHLWSALKIEF